MFPDSTCIYFSHLQHQKSRIQRKLFFQSSLQDPHEACFALLSGDESCPVRAKTHHSDFQSLVCSHPSRGRNQLSRPVSFGTLSTPHRLFFGHNKRRRHLCYRGWLYRHRCSVYQLCKSLMRIHPLPPSRPRLYVRGLRCAITMHIKQSARTELSTTDLKASKKC